MSWLFGRQKNSNLPEPTALQSQRSKQIQQLKSCTQNVSEIQRDVEYRVNVSIPGTYISLYINLPPQFPQDKPVVRVAPAVQHAWVNSDMIVTGCPDINNFVVNSDLGKAVQSIIQEFTQHPPVVSFQSAYSGSTQQPQKPYPVQPRLEATPSPMLPPQYNTIYSRPPGGQPPTLPPTLPYQAQPPPTLPPYTHPNVSLGQSDVQDHGVARGQGYDSATALLNTQSQGSTIRSYQMPEMPAIFPELRNMSEAELRSLADDEGSLLEMINKLPQLKKIVADRQELCEKNEQLARENLPQKPILEEKKKVLLEKYDKLNELRTEFDLSCSSQDHLRQQLEPAALQDRLKVAALEAEEEAEAVAEKFLDGSIAVDKFKTLYMEKRKLGYLRKAKEERLGTMIAQPTTGF